MTFRILWKRSPKTPGLASQVGVKAVNLEFARLLIDTLEARRNQLASRATVMAAASGALLLAYVQSALPTAMEHAHIGTIIAAAVGSLCAGAGLQASLKVVAGVGKQGRKRKKSMPRVRGHLLFYQTLMARDPAMLGIQLRQMSEVQILDEEAAQIVSLSRNLGKRYKAVERSYRYNIASVLLLIAGTLANEYYEELTSMLLMILERVK